MIASRPGSKMPHIEDFYWPDGIPDGSSNTKPYGDKSEYVDSEGKNFWICYTEAQIQRQCQQNGFFSPYIPLIMTY